MQDSTQRRNGGNGNTGAVTSLQSVTRQRECQWCCAANEENERSVFVGRDDEPDRNLRVDFEATRRHAASEKP